MAWIGIKAEFVMAAVVPDECTTGGNYSAASGALPRPPGGTGGRAIAIPDLDLADPGRHVHRQVVPVGCVRP